MACWHNRAYICWRCDYFRNYNSSIHISWPLVIISVAITVVMVML